MEDLSIAQTHEVAAAYKLEASYARPPSVDDWSSLLEELRTLLFPQVYAVDDPQAKLAGLRARLKIEIDRVLLMSGKPDSFRQTKRIVDGFMAGLSELRETLTADAAAAYDGDPSASSSLEVVLFYPGFTAIFYHRVAHLLHQLGTPLIPRCIAALTHRRTAIDIHYNARIGPGFFIDHGIGVVIGETCVIGKRVRLYHGVTLGTRNIPEVVPGVVKRSWPRHPVLEDGVVIYAGATILGRVTIGADSIIGANARVYTDVPRNSTITAFTR